MAKTASIRSQLTRIPEAKVGWVVGSTPDGAPLVDFEGNGAGPLQPLSTVALESDRLCAAVESRQQVILLFVDGDPRRPLLMGLVEPVPVSELPEMVQVDGKRISIKGMDEIVLQCGAASITLRRNGKLIIRGVQVESHAAGTNRLKGGSVQIN